MNTFADTYWWVVGMLKEQQAATTSMYPPFDVTMFIVIGNWYEVYHNNSLIGVGPLGTLFTWNEKKI